VYYADAVDAEVERLRAALVATKAMDAECTACGWATSFDEEWTATCDVCKPLREYLAHETGPKHE